MIRVLAAVVHPFATLDRILTDRRIDAARRDHAREMAVAAAVARGEYFRPQLADDTERTELENW